jgi:hypothetical protein
MGFLRTIYNVNDMFWDIDISDAGHETNEIQLNFKTANDEEQDISNLEFDISLKKDGQEIYSSHHPIFPIQYEKIKTSTLYVSKIEVIPDEEYVIETTTINQNFGVNYSNTLTFKTPKPPQPFASWSWDNTTKSWQSPVPHPDPVLGVDDYVEGRKLYQWSESQQQWLEGLPEDFLSSESNS